MKSLVLAASTALVLAGCARAQSPAAEASDAADASVGAETPTTSMSPSAPDSSGHVARYLALGDSFTIGTGTTPDRSFPARLTARWLTAGCTATLKNLGVNGYSTDDLLDEELPQAPAFAPTRVTLAVGANDIVRGRAPDDYRARVKKIFALLAAAGIAAPRIFVIPQPEWSSSPTAANFGNPADFAAKIVLFNQILQEETATAGARWVDLTARMHAEAAAKMIASDGLHPNAAAYDEWSADLAALGVPCE